jgi:hypothetical protein
MICGAGENASSPFRGSTEWGHIEFLAKADGQRVAVEVSEETI